MDWSVEYITASIALALLVILYFKKKWSGDLCHPVAATVVAHIINFKRLHDYLCDHHRRYKTYRITYPTFSYVYTTDPANVEHILRSNFANYVKGKFNHDIMEDLLGHGIFSVDGEPWRQQRKLASFEFSTKVLKDFSSVAFRENAVKLSKILLEACGAKKAVEMQGLLLKSTMDAICKLGFGVEMNSLSNANSGAEASFAEAFDSANAMLLWRYIDLSWKLKRYFNIGSEVTMKESIKTVDDFVYKLIQNRREEIFVQNNYVKPDILSRFVAMAEKHPENYSDKYLRDIILNFMIAGRDTTAVTLSWFFHLLCKSPDVEGKILQEICGLVKENECMSIEESISMFSQSLTHTVLDNMHYLQAALSEALRLHPAVPVDAKCVVSDDILPDGFKVKKGDIINYVPYSMGRMKYLWGSLNFKIYFGHYMDNSQILLLNPFVEIANPCQENPKTLPKTLFVLKFGWTPQRRWICFRIPQIDFTQQVACCQFRYPKLYSRKVFIQKKQAQR